MSSRDPQSISLMSVHKSKGLQAKVVFILSVDKGLYGFQVNRRSSNIRTRYGSKI